MQDIIHISDNLYISFDCKAVLLSGTPEEVLEQIEQHYLNASLFIININYKSETIYRSQSCGIKVLKLLRLKNYQQHCLLYSFFPREYFIKKNSENIILYSQGVSFMQLPENFGNLKIQTFLDKTKAPEDLSAYFKAESKLPDNRHFFANWWGVWQLWQVQKAIEKNTKTDKENKLEEKFGKAYEEMNSFQGLLARYLYKHEGIEEALKEKEDERKKHVEVETNNRNKIDISILDLSARIAEKERELEILTNLQTQIEQQKKEKRPLQIFFKTISNWFHGEIESNKIVSEELATIKKQIEISSQDIRKDEDLLQLLTDIETEKKRIDKVNRKNNDTLKYLNEQKSSSLNLLTYDDTLQRLRSKKPRIVYVDDQAEEGWSFILKRIIYGADDDGLSFNDIIPDKDEDNVQIAQNICHVVKNQKAELLILDLRLKGETGVSNPKKISGIQVLELLNQQRLPCPILITTASNKIWTYKQTFISGATAFWTKEGLDDRYDTSSSVDNYLSFIDLVYTLCFSDEVKFLYNTFLSKIDKFIKEERIFWWQTKFWKDQSQFFVKKQVANKEDIDEILRQAFKDLQDTLRIAIQSGSAIELDSRYVSLTVIRLSQILELIHSTCDNNPESIAEKIRCQFNLQQIDDANDYTIRTNRLQEIRNDAAHRFNIDFNKLKEYIELLFEYLNGKRFFNIGDSFKPAQSPEDGKYYQSRVVRIDKGDRFDKLILENPNLALENNIYEIIVNLKKRGNDYLFDEIEIQVDDLIEFKLHIHKQGQVVTGYFGKEAKKL